jgi:hypothetical protein
MSQFRASEMPKRRKSGKITRKKQFTRKRSHTTGFRHLSQFTQSSSRGAFRNKAPFAFENFDSFCRIAAGIGIHRIFPDDKRQHVI